MNDRLSMDKHIKCFITFTLVNEMLKQVKNGTILIKGSEEKIEGITIKDKDGNFVIFDEPSEEEQENLKIKYRGFKAKVNTRLWQKNLKKVPKNNSVRYQLLYSSITVGVLSGLLAFCDNDELCPSATDAIKQFVSLIVQMIDVYINY